ncbi:hypothetical protein ACJMK2_003800 [Sinanodonta woodiana]|uniref:Transmembrane protein n=1 Tax=Sinanodonta woodiana TaxID=1069815 RepID=A0ABD3Y119_SINWO
MTIPCHCAVVTTAMTYDGHITTCSDNSTEVTQLHPINLSLLQQFFNATHLTAILGNTSFDNPLTVSIPEFKLYEHQMSQFFATNKEIDLSLKKVAARAKNNQRIFSSLAESMLSGEISVDEDSWFDSKSIMTIVSLSMSILNTSAIVWLIWRFRTLATALSLIQATKAEPTVHFQYTIAPTTTAPNWFTTVSDVLTWDHLIFTVSIMTFAIALIQVYKWVPQSNARTKLRLEITTGVQCVLVDILQLGLCPSYWNITGPLMIDNLHVTGYLRPRLHVAWTGFKLTKANTNFELTMPTSFSIDLVSAIKLRSIFSKPFCAHVIWTHHDITFPLRPDGSVSECSPRTYPAVPPYSILP